MEERAEILLVDDHSLILEGICRILERVPEVIIVDAVTTGHEAAALISKRDYDIYILDVSLPGELSGHDLVDMIREVNEDARIIISTMHDEVWVMNKLIRQGVNAVILKSSASCEMEKAVRQVLQGDSYACPGFESIQNKLSLTSAHIHPKNVPTKRELEVLREVAKGFCTHEIAGKLNIKENTVETFRKRLIQKLDAKNAIDMVVKGISNGWVDVD